MTGTKLFTDWGLFSHVLQVSDTLVCVIQPCVCSYGRSKVLKSIACKISSQGQPFVCAWISVVLSSPRSPLLLVRLTQSGISCDAKDVRKSPSTRNMVNPCVLGIVVHRWIQFCLLTLSRLIVVFKVKNVELIRTCKTCKRLVIETPLSWQSWQSWSYHLCGDYLLQIRSSCLIIPAAKSY